MGGAEHLTIPPLSFLWRFDMDPRYPSILSAVFYVIWIIVGLVWLVEHLNIGG